MTYSPFPRVNHVVVRLAMLEVFDFAVAVLALLVLLELVLLSFDPKISSKMFHLAFQLAFQLAVLAVLEILELSVEFLVLSVVSASPLVSSHNPLASRHNQLTFPPLASSHN